MSNHINEMVTAYAEALGAYDALTVDVAKAKETMRKGFGTLLALRDVEGLSGRAIAGLEGVPAQSSQVARDLRAAEILAAFPKADPKDVKKACDLLTAKAIKEAMGSKNPLTALMEAAGIKKVERRGPQKRKTDATKPKTDDQKASQKVTRTLTAKDVVAFLKGAPFTADDFDAIAKTAMALANDKAKAEQSVAEVS